MSICRYISSLTVSGWYRSWALSAVTDTCVHLCWQKRAWRVSLHFCSIGRWRHLFRKNHLQRLLQPVLDWMWFVHMPQHCRQYETVLTSCCSAHLRPHPVWPEGSKAKFCELLSFQRVFCHPLYYRTWEKFNKDKATFGMIDWRKHVITAEMTSVLCF